MWLARALKQKQAHPVLLPARPPLPAAAQQPPAARGAPSPGEPHHPRCPIALGCQCCQGGIWCVWAAAQEPLGLVFSWLPPPLPVWGMPEDRVVPRFSLQLPGDVAAQERETHWCPFLPSLPTSSPRWRRRLPQRWGHSRGADPDRARGLTASAQGRQRGEAPASKQGNRAPFSWRSRCSRWPESARGTAAAACAATQYRSGKGAGERGPGNPEQTCAGSPGLAQQELINPTDAAMLGRRSRPAMAPASAPVLLPAPAARCCTLVRVYLLERLLRRAGTRRD